MWGTSIRQDAFIMESPEFCEWFILVTAQYSPWLSVWQCGRTVCSRRAPWTERRPPGSPAPGIEGGHNHTGCDKHTLGIYETYTLQMIWHGNTYTLWYWPLVRELTLTVGFPSQGLIMQSFDVFFVASLNQLLNKQSSHQCNKIYDVENVWLSEPPYLRDVHCRLPDVVHSLGFPRRFPYDFSKVLITKAL